MTAPVISRARKRTLVASVLGWGLLAAVLVAQELPLQRISGAKPILESDSRELLRLTKVHGSPWLIVEPEEVQVQGNWHARVYLQPEAPHTPVRRGRLLLLSARVPPDHVGDKTWQVRLSAYAQVPASGAGSFSTTAQDLPFIESHRLPDADLLSLVAFVRSSPSAPERSNPDGPSHRINGAMPIWSIRRGDGNDIEVSVMRDRSAAWILTLRQDGGTWRAISVAFVIA